MLIQIDIPSHVLQSLEERLASGHMLIPMDSDRSTLITYCLVSYLGQRPNVFKANPSSETSKSKGS